MPELHGHQLQVSTVLQENMKCDYIDPTDIGEPSNPIQPAEQRMASLQRQGSSRNATQAKSPILKGRSKRHVKMTEKAR